MTQLNANAGATDESGIAQPQMTPMIDVVFQMLIFFMVGMQIRSPEGRLDAFLPKDQGVATESPPEDTIKPPEVRIRIFKDEQTAEIRIMFEQYQCDDIPDLEGKLVQLGSAMSSIPVVIDGGPEVPFQFVLGALNACKKARFTDVSFKAPPKQE